MISVVSRNDPLPFAANRPVSASGTQWHPVAFFTGCPSHIARSNSDLRQSPPSRVPPSGLPGIDVVIPRTTGTIVIATIFLLVFILIILLIIRILYIIVTARVPKVTIRLVHRARSPVSARLSPGSYFRPVSHCSCDPRSVSALARAVLNAPLTVRPLRDLAEHLVPG